MFSRNSDLGGASSLIKRSGPVLFCLVLCLAVAACGGASGAPRPSATSRGIAIQIATLTPTPQPRVESLVATPLPPAGTPINPTTTAVATATAVKPSPSATPQATATTTLATATTAPTQIPAASTATAAPSPAPQTPVPAPPGPTQTPSPAPAATGAASAGSVQVVGDSSFTSWTDQALALLQASAPSWYAQVETYLTEILQVPTGTGRITVGTRTFQAGPDTVYAPTLTPAQQLAWYAGSIVHDSCHERLYETGQQFKGKDAEIACLKDQEAALRQITSESFLPDYVQSLIDGADDPANQYWLNPHW